jgi:hypothetical protein
MKIKLISIFVAVFITALLFLSYSSAHGQQETCPDWGSWIKIEGISGKEYTYTAPENALIDATCYKAGTNVVISLIEPPQRVVTIISAYQFDLSHIAVRLIYDPSTPTVAQTQTNTSTNTVTPSLTSTPDPFTSTPTLEQTGTQMPTITITSTGTIVFGVEKTPADQPSGGDAPNIGIPIAFVLSTIFLVGISIIALKE